MAIAWSRRSVSPERSRASQRHPRCSRGSFEKHRVSWLAALLILALGEVSEATVDLTGDWYITNAFGSPVVLVHFVQAGTDCSPEPGCSVSLQVSGAFTSTSGTIDPGTGYFAASFLDEPYTFCGYFSWHGHVSTDGSTFTGGWDIPSTSPDCDSPTCLCRSSVFFPLDGSRSPCGDGIVDSGETCDDGSLGLTGCCSLGCTVAPSGTSCESDGHLCTSDICDATGTCTHPPQTCRAASRSLLLVKKKSDITKDTLIWKWTKGANTSQAEFADPTSTADYELCIFTGTTSALVDDVVIPASASKWSTLGTTGYKYRDPAAAASGIDKVVLKGSDQNTSKVRVRGEGAPLALLPLPATAPVTVQLVNGDNGVCWGASFSDPQLLKNDTGQLKAVVP